MTAHLLPSVIGAVILAALLVPAGARLFMQLAMLIAEALRRHANATERAYRGYRAGWQLDNENSPDVSFAVPTREL